MASNDVYGTQWGSEPQSPQKQTLGQASILPPIDIDSLQQVNKIWPQYRCVSILYGTTRDHVLPFPINAADAALIKFGEEARVWPALGELENHFMVTAAVIPVA